MFHEYFPLKTFADLYLCTLQIISLVRREQVSSPRKNGSMQGVHQHLYNLLRSFFVFINIKCLKLIPLKSAQTLKIWANIFL